MLMRFGTGNCYKCRLFFNIMKMSGTHRLDNSKSMVPVHANVLKFLKNIYTKEQHTD